VASEYASSKPRVSCTVHFESAKRYIQTLVKDPEWPAGKAAVDYYFIQDDGGMFKVTYVYEPYFYIACKVRALSISLKPDADASYSQDWRLQ